MHRSKNESSVPTGDVVAPREDDLLLGPLSWLTAKPILIALFQTHSSTEAEVDLVTMMMSFF